jgi:hypothetical protein
MVPFCEGFSMTCVGATKKKALHSALTFAFSRCLSSKGRFALGGMPMINTQRRRAAVATDVAALLALVDFLLDRWNQSLWNRRAAKNTAIKPASLTIIEFRQPSPTSLLTSVLIDGR